MERSGYNSDVSDKQWERLQGYLPKLSTRGAHLRKWELRVIINASLYGVTTGCQWRVLPKDFPPWQSVYYHYNKWCENDTWFLIHQFLHRQTRERGSSLKDWNFKIGLIASGSDSTLETC